MKTDALSRRSRFAPPNPSTAKRSPRRIKLVEADYLIFEAINRHGPLPSNFLYEFQMHLRGGETYFKNRLTEFYNGDEGGPYLSRPAGQFAGFDARYQHVVYDITARARRALGEDLCPLPPTGSTWFLHQLMQACVGASLELRSPVGYVSRAEVALSDKSGHAREARNPMAIPLPGTDNQKTLIPDDLFALANAEGKKRYFIVEIDRATEAMNPKAEHAQINQRPQP